MPLTVMMEESQEPEPALDAIREQLNTLLAAADPMRVIALYEAVQDGQIDGGHYHQQEGGSCCVIGHLRPFKDGGMYGPYDTNTELVEAFVYDILPGQTPETHSRLAHLQGWIQDWMREQVRIAVTEEVQLSTAP